MISGGKWDGARISIVWVVNLFINSYCTIINEISLTLLNLGCTICLRYATDSVILNVGELEVNVGFNISFTMVVSLAYHNISSIFKTVMFRYSLQI